MNIFHWTQEEAIQLCVQIERVCPVAGCHVALTGGLLYKIGQRKDLDLIFYRIRQVAVIDYQRLWEELKSIGISNVAGFGWRFVGDYCGKKIDLLFPEEKVGEDYVKKT